MCGDPVASLLRRATSPTTLNPSHSPRRVTSLLHTLNGYVTGLPLTWRPLSSYAASSGPPG